MSVYKTGPQSYALDTLISVGLGYQLIVYLDNELLSSPLSELQIFLWLCSYNPIISVA